MDGTGVSGKKLGTCYGQRMRRAGGIVAVCSLPSDGSAKPMVSRRGGDDGPLCARLGPEH